MLEVQARRTGWVKVALGDVVRLSTERSRDPIADGFERLVGLEHLDAGDLRIRRWGNVAGGTTFTNVFRPGQVLFGRRRAYQRKVASADFSGVCSGDIYVLEPKGPHLLAELLPFVCQTDAFFEHAVGTSAGSLSPRTNWASLASFEFELPPLEVQHQMAMALWAWQNVVDSLRQAIKTSEILFESMLEFLLSDVQQASHPTVPLQHVAVVERGRFSHRPRNLPEFYGGPYPFAQTGDVAAARGYQFKPSQTLSDAGLQHSRSFPPNTVLVTIAAVIGATAITSEETWCPDSVVGIMPGDPRDAQFIDYAMRFLRPYLENQVATQTAQKNINLAVLRPLEIPWPNSAARRAIVLRLSNLENSMDQLSARQRALQGIPGAILALQGLTGR